MKRSTIAGFIAALALHSGSLPFAATVYRTVDERGVVSFSDTPPPDGVEVEIMQIDEQTAVPSEQTEQRLREMRETTDRMAADRMARERHRAEMRQLAAQTEARLSSPQPVDYVEPPTFITGYWGAPVRRTRPWRPKPPHPEHPIVKPPWRPPAQQRPPGIRPLPGNEYPASLIRRHYDPRAQEVFRRQTVAHD